MTPPDPRLRGLYAITDPVLLPDERLLAGVAAAIRGGARLVQYRDKGRDRDRRLAQARALARLCSESDALLIVNDDPELAAEAGAHGVHLGRDDAPVAEARRLLGESAIIGVSCYADPARAERFAAEADYLAFGRFFPSRTKPDALPADPALLGDARRLGRPLAAIGGITADNGAGLFPVPGKQAGQRALPTRNPARKMAHRLPAPDCRIPTSGF